MKEAVVCVSWKEGEREKRAQKCRSVYGFLDRKFMLVHNRRGCAVREKWKVSLFRCGAGAGSCCPAAPVAKFGHQDWGRTRTTALGWTVFTPQPLLHPDGSPGVL